MLGIGDDSIVIAYDDTGGVTAGRLVVMLRMIGRNAAVLDGGVALWPREPCPVPGAVPEHLEFTPCEWPVERLADADQTADSPPPMTDSSSTPAPPIASPERSR